MEEQKPVRQQNLGRPPDGENRSRGEAVPSDTEDAAGRDKEGRANREIRQTPGRWFGMSPDRFLLVLFNGLLAVFTGTYAWFSYQQWKALNNTLRETRKVAESARVSADAAKNSADYLSAEERAWVSVKTLVLQKEPSVGDSVDVHIPLINTGKTPALDIACRGEIVLSKDGPPQLRYQESGAVASRTVLPPGPVDQSFALLRPPVSTEELSLYKSRRAHMYVYGIVRYKDVFGKSHYSTFCAFHVSGNAADMFEFCEHGNELH